MMMLECIHKVNQTQKHWIFIYILPPFFFYFYIRFEIVIENRKYASISRLLLLYSTWNIYVLFWWSEVPLLYLWTINISNKNKRQKMLDFYEKNNNFPAVCLEWLTLENFSGIGLNCFENLRPSIAQDAFFQRLKIWRRAAQTKPKQFCHYPRAKLNWISKNITAHFQQWIVFCGFPSQFSSAHLK